jgi:hypothetical protein
MATPPTPPLTPQLRAWVEHERVRGAQVVRAIMRQRGLIRSDTHGLEQFTMRMALVNLTGSVASWANGLHDGLSKTGNLDAARVFAVSPPFAATDPTTGDYDQLGDFVEARTKVLQELLASDAP